MLKNCFLWGIGVNPMTRGLWLIDIMHAASPFIPSVLKVASVVLQIKLTLSK